MYFIKKEKVNSELAIKVTTKKELLQLIKIFERSYYYMEQYDNDKLLRNFDLNNGAVYRPVQIQTNDLYCFLEHADEEYYFGKNVKVISLNEFRNEYCVNIVLRD